MTRRQELKDLDKLIAQRQEWLVDLEIQLRLAEQKRDLAIQAAQQLEGAKARLLRDLAVLGREVYALEQRKREALIGPIERTQALQPKWMTPEELVVRDRTLDELKDRLEVEAA